MKKTIKFLIPIFIFLMLVVPVLSFGEWKGLVFCDNLTPTTQCDFNALMALVNKVINFIFVSLVVPIAAIMFFYAGFLMITAGGESASSRTKAKGIFTNALFGLVIAAGSWVIIHTILVILGYEGDWIGF